MEQIDLGNIPNNTTPFQPLLHMLKALFQYENIWRLHTAAELQPPQGRGVSILATKASCCPQKAEGIQYRNPLIIS